MKRITLAMMLAALSLVSAAASVAHAQNPPPASPPVPAAPATPAAPAAPVTPTARPFPTPRPARIFYGPGDGIGIIDADQIDRIREVAREGREMATAAREASREVIVQNREIMEAQREAMRAASMIDREQFAPLAALAPIGSLPPMPAMAPTTIYRGGDVSVRMPPAPWAQGDPADSVYRVARNALNVGEYGRAARMFQDIQQKYPKSAYQADAIYYEAYARYKVGTTDELEKAAKLLEPLATKTMNVSNSSSNDGFYAARRGASDSEVATLYNRINGVLAQRGNRDAANKVAKAAAQGGTSICDNEDIQVRVEAMNALSQMDPTAAMPLLRKVLDRKDECSSELRRRAVFMLGRRGDAESAQLLIAAAKSDPSYTVRSEAISALPRLTGDVGLNALEDMLRTEQDERIQRSIVRSLTSSDNQKARQSMRALIDRKDAPLSLRVEAVSSFNNDHATADDAAYLRNLYGKADNDHVKEAIIGAVGRMGGADNDKWVLAIAQNQNEPSQLRAAAISRLLRSNSSIADLNKLYDSADSYNIRSQIVNVLANRKEPEATDKLLDIVKNSTVVDLRKQAMNAITRKNDPRSTQLLMDIIDKGRP
jgi:HEAT repeat protein/TolA-binding protein